MANATKDLKIDAGQGQDFSFPVAASTKIYAGTFGATDASGNAISTLTSASKIWGRVEKQVDNSSGAAGDLRVEVREGKFFFTNDATNPCANANRGQLCYAVDNNTVGTSDVGGTLPVAGVIVDVPSSGQPGYGYVYVDVGKTRPDAVNTELASSIAASYTARNVATSLPTTFTVTSGALLSDNNGALGSQDGVTNVVGDVIILPVGTVGSGTVSAANSGPWKITAVGGASAKWAAIRPDWWANGASIVPGASIAAGGEGTLFAGTIWKTFAASSIVIGTGDPALYPEKVTQQITLSAGTATISNVPIRSASKLGVDFAVAGGTPAGTTTGFQTKLSGGIAAGALGTAAVIVEAQSVVGTKVNTDVTVLNVTLMQ